MRLLSRERSWRVLNIIKEEEDNITKEEDNIIKEEEQAPVIVARWEWRRERTPNRPCLGSSCPLFESLRLAKCQVLVLCPFVWLCTCLHLGLACQVLVLCPFVWLCTCPHLSFVQLPHIDNPSLHFRRNKPSLLQRFRTYIVTPFHRDTSNFREIGSPYDPSKWLLLNKLTQIYTKFVKCVVSCLYMQNNHKPEQKERSEISDKKIYKTSARHK